MFCDAHQLFSLSNPEASVLLSGCESTPGLECTQTDIGETNLIDTRSGHQYVYDQTGAYASAFIWRQQFSLYKVDVFFVFGVGLGYEWNALKPWLDADPKKNVIFLEDDLAMLHHFLQQPQAKEIISHSQTRVYYVDNGKICQHVAEILGWNFFDKRKLFAASSYYAKYRPKGSKKLEQKIRLVHNELQTVLEEFSSFGKLQFRNFFRNIYAFQNSRFGSDLFHAFKGVPAIVVAAGPSLEGCFQDLRLMQDSALILSGGTATNALLEEGIRPHICAAVDPNPAQYSRIKQIHPFGIPMLYQSRVLPEGIKGYAGELLYLRGGNGQPLIEWIDTELGIFGPKIDGGHSISNMIIELAHLMGCSPIIMVGYDLSYPEGKMYPASVREALSDKEQEDFQKKITGSITTVGNDGNDVSTEEKWIVEADWILHYYQDRPRLKLFNTSLKGLRIGTVPCISFAEVLKKYGKKAHSVQAKVHTEIMKARPLPFSMEKVFVTLEKIMNSIKSCMELLPKVQAGDMLAEELWKKEIVYQHFLKLYDNMFDKKIQMQRLFHEVELMQNEEIIREFEIRVEEERYQFLAQGLPLLAQWIRDFSAMSVYEGFFPPEKVRLNRFETPSLLPEHFV